MKIIDGLVISKSQMEELIKVYTEFKDLASSGEYMVLNVKIEEIENILELSKPLEPIIRAAYIEATDYYIKIDQYIDKTEI